jgi:hypothetical protein
VIVTSGACKPWSRSGSSSVHLIRQAAQHPKFHEAERVSSGGTGCGEGPLMALLRRKRLVRFGTQVPTLVKQPEREIVTYTGLS